MIEQWKGLKIVKGSEEKCIKWKRRRSQSIKKQIAMVLAALMVGMLGIFFYSFINFYNLQENIMKESQQMMTEQMASSVSKTCEQIDKLIQSVAYNQMVQEYLTETDSGRKYEEYKNIVNLLHNTKNINSGIIDIVIVGQDGNCVNLEGNATMAESLVRQLPNDENVYYFGSQNYHVFNQQRLCVMAGTWIYSLDPNGFGMKKLGAVFCVIDPASLLEIPIYKSEVEMDSVLWDRDGNLLLGEESIFRELMESGEENGKIQVGGEGYLTLTYDVEILGGGVTTLVSVESYRSKILSVMLQQCAMLAVIFLLVGIVLLLGVKRVYGSINELTAIMKRIKEGNRTALKERLPVSGGSLEADSAAEAFNGMLDEIDNLNHDIFHSYTRMYEMEMAAKQSELNYLRSQINPHFLYNTLELICGLSLEGGNSQGIVEIARALGNTLRYSIKGSDLVTLRQEVEVTQNYLMIQLKRFEGRFHVEYDFQQETMVAQTPKMVLQPLVENAIGHGLEERLEPGTLRLSSRISEEGALLLCVEDDGLGIEPEILELLQKKLENGGKPDSSSESEGGIGLANVSSRIKLYYGKEYGVTIESKQYKGTRVTIRLPFIQEEQSLVPLP